MSGAETDVQAAKSQPPARSSLWMALVGLTAAVLGVAAVALFLLRDNEPAAPASQLDLGAVVAVDGVPRGIVNLQVGPALSGENQIVVELEPSEDPMLADIDRVDVALLPLVAGGEEQVARIDLSGNPRRGAADVTLEGALMWQAEISEQTTDVRLLLTTLYFMVPDPNLHGNDAIPLPETDPEAEQLYVMASQAVAGLHRVTYEQDLSDGLGLAVLSHRAVNDGTDGSEPGFSYVNPGGFEAVVLGTTAWSRYPGEEWDIRETNQMVPPSEWGGEYSGATGFQMGPVAETPAGSCRMITFVVPEEPRRSIAWYAWCIDERSGNVFRDAMISRNHYMVTSFNNFDADIVIEPPTGAERREGG
jgi:hypothetical protein